MSVRGTARHVPLRARGIAREAQVAGGVLSNYFEDKEADLTVARRASSSPARRKGVDVTAMPL